jgi:polar amino acid transport system substrate-binding protein
LKLFKKISAALLIFVLALGLAACGSKDPAPVTTPTPEPAPAAVKFIVGLDDHFPPMGFRDEANNIVGFDIDLAKAVAAELGFEIEFLPIDWAVKDQELAAGNVDCLWNGYTLTEQRKTDLSVSAPYMKNRQIVITLADSPVAALTDLAGKTLALQSGSSANDALDSVPDFAATLSGVLFFEDNTRALMDLEAGGCDAVLMDEVVAKYYVTQDGKYQIVPDSSLAEEEYGIGFRKADTELRDKVDQALKDLKADGTAASISTEWFGEDVTIIAAN